MCLVGFPAPVASLGQPETQEMSRQSCWDFVHKATVPKQAYSTGGRSLVLDEDIKMGNWLALTTEIPRWLRACQE